MSELAIVRISISALFDFLAIAVKVSTLILDFLVLSVNPDFALCFFFLVQTSLPNHYLDWLLNNSLESLAADYSTFEFDHLSAFIRGINN